MTTAGIAPTVIAGGATLVGALGLYAIRRPSDRALQIMLAAAGGVMLAAVSFSLLVPALAGEEGAGAAWLVLAFVAGAFGTWGLQLVLPDGFDLAGTGSLGSEVGRRTTLLVAAVALHNVPEGLAVGVGVGNDPDGTGLALAVGIMAQNVPEGLAVAVALAALGASRTRAVLLSGMTGVVEVVAGLIGLTVAGISATVLPFMLAAAAGAMLFVVVHEIGPETSRHEDRNASTMAMIAGFAGMLLLDALVA